MKRWTPDDISKLKRIAQDYPAAKTADELGRGFAATQGKSA